MLPPAPRPTIGGATGGEEAWSAMPDFEQPASRTEVAKLWILGLAVDLKNAQKRVAELEQQRGAVLALEQHADQYDQFVVEAADIRAVYAEHGDGDDSQVCPTTGDRLRNIATIDSRWVCCGGLYPDHAEPEETP
jgi:hypothetical protein